MTKKKIVQWLVTISKRGNDTTMEEFKTSYINIPSNSYLVQKINDNHFNYGPRQTLNTPLQYSSLKFDFYITELPPSINVLIMIKLLVVVQYIKSNR